MLPSDSHIQFFAVVNFRSELHCFPECFFFFFFIPHSSHKMDLSAYTEIAFSAGNNALHAA